MKKLVSLIMTLCMMATVFCVTAFAVEPPADGVVLRVSAEKRDGSDSSIVVIQDYTVFEDGWNAAMELADNSKWMNDNGYARVVVDLYADWDADDGQFTEAFINGSGFNWDAIYFQDGVRMTLNMNGHTIDRGLTEEELNGEVMYIDEKADIIINNGTITGGFSDNGAGGIQIEANARVTLNNVNVEGNSIEDHEGAGIAMYNGATLIMNGGSLSSNSGCVGTEHAFGAGLYLRDSDATLNDVLICDNVITGGEAAASGRVAAGAACYVYRSTLMLNGCTIQNNSTSRYGGAISACDGNVIINNCTITGNATKFYGSALDLNGGTCFVENSNLVGNQSTKYDAVIYVQGGKLQISNSEHDPQIVCENGGEVLFEDAQETSVGSMFGEGSLNMVVSMAALLVAIASMGVAVTSKKKASDK